MTHTSTEQPEALYFADVLDNFYSGISRGDATGAAAALRRQHARILELEASQAQREPLSDGEIETLRRATFSTDNPFCPCDSKTMRKAVWATERAHGITQENL